MNDVIFKIISYGSPEYEAAVKLREGILRKPLGLTFLPEEREAEKDHIQIAGFQENDLISTAVLVPEGQNYKMQRIVVKEGLQGAGIGAKMMDFCESYAKNKSIHSIYCYSRYSAVRFYLKNNYVAEGEYFDKNTIPHLKMRKVLLE